MRLMSARNYNIGIKRDCSVSAISDGRLAVSGHWVGQGAIYRASTKNFRFISRLRKKCVVVVERHASPLRKITCFEHKLLTFIFHLLTQHSALRTQNSIRILLFCLLLLCSACNGNTADNAIATQHSVASTGLFVAQATTTVLAARLETTLDYVSTRVSFAATQSQFLKATLVQAGTPIDYLEAYQRSVFTGAIVLPTATARPQATAGSLQQMTQIALTLPTVTPFGVTPTGTAPRLDNIVMATSVGNDDCALGAVLQFTADVPEIYVVATAYNIAPGTQLASRWRIGDNEKVFDFTPDFAIDGKCIWFFVDQTDFTFVPGTWSVALEINGTPAAPATQFVIQ